MWNIIAVRQCGRDQHVSFAFLGQTTPSASDKAARPAQVFHAHNFSRSRDGTQDALGGADVLRHGTRRASSGTKDMVQKKPRRAPEMNQFANRLRRGTAYRSDSPKVRSLGRESMQASDIHVAISSPTTFLFSPFRRSMVFSMHSFQQLNSLLKGESVVTIRDAFQCVLLLIWYITHNPELKQRENL